MAAEMAQQCNAIAKQPAKEDNVTTTKRKDDGSQYLVCPTSSWPPRLLMVWQMPLSLLPLLLLSCVALASLEALALLRLGRGLSRIGRCINGLYKLRVALRVHTCAATPRKKQMRAAQTMSEVGT